MVQRLSQCKRTPGVGYHYTVILLSMLSVSISCGYQVGHSYMKKLPFGIRKLAIPLCTNVSFENNIEVTFTRKLIQQFQHNKFIDIVPREDAEAILICTLKRVEAVPVAYPISDDGTLGVAKYQLAVILDAVLIKLDTGELLWQSNNIRFNDIFLAGPSPHMSAANRKSAISRIATRSAKAIHILIMDRF